MSFKPRGVRRIQVHDDRLSLCMIVKDEAANLEQCLQLARPHVDEIVVVDTGSTDGTQDIARRYADVFDEIAWPGSFSTARNHSFDLASGAYVLVLDGDEYMPEAEDWRRLRKALRERNVAALRIRVRNLLPADKVMAADVSWSERVFLNHPMIRWEGRVHNQIVPALNRYLARYGGRVLEVPATCIHTGYALAAPDLAAKYEPRLSLLHAEYEQAETEELRAYYGFQLGVSYYILRRYADGDAVFDRLAFDRLAGHNRFYARLVAAQTAFMTNEADKGLRHADAMLTLDRKEPIGYFLAAYGLLRAQHAREGLLMLVEAFRVNDEGNAEVRFPLNEAQIFKLIAEVCHQVGLFERAAFFYHAYLKHHPADAAVRQALADAEQQLRAGAGRNAAA